MKTRIAWPTWALCALAASGVRAQAPASAPLILRLSAGTRATSVASAWVAGRDEDVVFYNPAQIASRSGFNLSFARYGDRARQVSMASAYAAGPRSLALGWGIQFADFHAPDEGSYPLSPDVVSTGGPVDASALEAVIGASVAIKGFRIGVAGKFATDRVSASAAHEDRKRDIFLADAGIARNIFSGTAALAIQNIGEGVDDDGRTIDAPLQASLGWSTTRWQPGPFDLGVYSQVTARTGWIAPALGAELGYGWIDGFSAALRAGVHRPDAATEKPLVLGGAFTGDHLTIEYAHQFFDGGHHANRMTIRWR